MARTVSTKTEIDKGVRISKYFIGEQLIGSARSFYNPDGQNKVVVTTLDGREYETESMVTARRQLIEAFKNS